MWKHVTEVVDGIKIIVFLIINTKETEAYATPDKLIIYFVLLL